MVKEVKDADKRYDYVNDYIYESSQSRDSLKRLIERVILNYKKHPSRNTYKENAYKYYKSYVTDHRDDPVSCNYLKSMCDSIPEATNDTIFNAVETVVSMAQGGIGQFEYQPADEYLDKDPELADEQSAFLKYMYESNHLDALAPETIRKGVMQGQFNWMIKPVKRGFKISLIDAYKMIIDPRASKTNRPRYIGYQEVESWSDVKDYLTTVKEDGRYYVNVINDVDMYMDELRSFGEPRSGYERWSAELSEDLNTFQSIYRTAFMRGSKSVDKKGENTKNPATEPGYKGDDVEVSYLWDLDSDIYFVVINRRFIVYMKNNPLSKKIKINIPYKDLKTGELKSKKVDYEVKVDSPLVHRGYIDADWETYPITPLFYCLDDFDNICSKESVLEHDFSIMAPITFMSTSYDAERFASTSSVAGAITEGTQNTLTVLNKSYDLSAITSSIQRSEERIKRMMGATDQFELMQLLNNRASGAEVSMANGAVSQRMNILLAKVEDGYAELMTKMLKMQIIFSDDDAVYMFPYKDGVSAFTNEDLIGNSLIRVKLASRIKVEQQQQSQNALMVLQTLSGLSQAGVNLNNVVSSLVPIITQGVVNRRTADSFISSDLKLDPAMLNAAINENEKQREKQRAEGPMTLDDMTNLTPDQMSDLENMAQGIVNQQGQTDQTGQTDDYGDTNSNLGNDELDQDALAELQQYMSSHSLGGRDDMPSDATGGSQSGLTSEDDYLSNSDANTSQNGLYDVSGAIPTGADQVSPIPKGMPADMAGNVANQSSQGTGPVRS